MLFEEKLEVGAGRWSAPHVPTLALPSLQKLRSLLAEGLVLLDCPAQSFLELVGRLGNFAGIFPISHWIFPKVLELSRAHPIPSHPRDCPFLLQDRDGKSRVKEKVHCPLHFLRLPERKKG